MRTAAQLIATVLKDALAGGVSEAAPREPLSPNCEACGDIGFLYPRLPEDHPKFGQKQTCLCRNAATTGQIERAWRLSGFEERHINCRLETHPIYREGGDPRLLAELANPTDAGDVPGWYRSWWLFGPNSHGKTGLAAGHSRARLLATGESVCMRPFLEILNELRESYNPHPVQDTIITTEAALLFRYTTVGLLVLDDLGAEDFKVRDDGGSWALDRLFTIISRRHAKRLPVFVTSNLDPVQLAAQMPPVMGQRIIQRLIEMCAGRDHIVPVKHRNLRLSK